ncbi:MAG: glutathione S-transferase family protein [Myxococcota bacterium]|nr:glutathione S-transferase family protein [Myxococcota bacterium]
MDERPRIYRAITCNFCHRAEVALAAKGIEYEAIEIDLVKRPAWFREKASGGSVPLLEWNGIELHPSTVINEFIEEQWPEPALLPSDPAERAAARMWIEWWNTTPCPAYERRLMNVRPERDAVLTEALEAGLRECETRLAARNYAGKYWGGDTLGLVDATAAPMFVRFAGLRHFHDIDIPSDCERVRQWRDVLLADPHVEATRPDEAELLAAYTYYREVLTKAAAAGIEVPVAKGD